MPTQNIWVQLHITPRLLQVINQPVAATADKSIGENDSAFNFDAYLLNIDEVFIFVFPALIFISLRFNFFIRYSLYLIFIYSSHSQ
jgi:hypothetical protein